MRIGIPTEIKTDEYRVAITPAGVRELTRAVTRCWFRPAPAMGSAMTIPLPAQGAQIAPDAAAVFAEADLVLKVKEPQPAEVGMLREGQTLFTYLHLAAEPTWHVA